MKQVIDLKQELINSNSQLIIGKINSDRINNLKRKLIKSTKLKYLEKRNDK